MKYLWCSYKVCKDFEFREYMKCKKQDYDDNYPVSAFTIDELIRAATNLYTIHTYKVNYVWGSKSPEESEIVVLKAEVGQLKGNLQLAGKIMKKYGSKTSSGNSFTKNKKKKLKEDLDFVAINKNPPKDDEPHE